MKIPYRIEPKYNARDDLIEFFDVDLPIEGGWGYEMADAVIINKKHPSVNPNMPFYGVGHERTFAIHRLYIELIIMRPKDDRYAGIEWHKGMQRVVESDGRSFDHIQGKATALRASDWDMLKERWEAPNGYGSDGFDEQSHHQLHNKLTQTFECEYWFDITSFLHSY